MIAIALVVITIILVLKTPTVTININKTMSIKEQPQPIIPTTQEDMSAIYKELNQDLPPSMDDFMEAFNKTIHNIEGGSDE